MQFARDSLTNLVSRMGTDRDKASASFYADPLLTDDQLANAYRGAWLPRKIVDIPALDSVRAWRDWQAKGGQIEQIEGEENRLNVKGKVLEARIKARLWGGSAIMIGTGDLELAQELRADRVEKGGVRYLTVLSRRQLTAGEIIRDPQSEWYGKPGSYTLAAGDKQQVTIHPSRLVLFHGASQPEEEVFTAYPGWGDSVLLAVMQAIKQADGTAANIASLVFEAKVNIIRIPQFMASLGDEGYKAKLLERYTLAATSKGINGDLLLDKEEEYEQRQVSFATLPEVLMSFMQIVSGAADIPATRLLGQSPAGMNSTGESDLRNYYDRLQAMQAIEMTPALARLDECLIRSATGKRDPDIYYEWAPLWGLSEKERADIFKTKSDAARAIAGGSGQQPLMPVEALSDALVNAFVEDGSLPGLEAAIDQYGKLADQEEDEDEVDAALGGEGNVSRLRVAANDAEPRTLYVRRDVLNAAEIIAWAKAQGFESTLPASDLHVTIAYSREKLDWMKVEQDYRDFSGNGTGKLTVSAGGPRLMEQFGKATVLLFSSSDLQWRHMAIREAGASWDHEEYQPHITISYEFDGSLGSIEPYRGKIELGPEIFEEVDEDWSSKLTEA
nr:anti-CBASS Acb1 family protein [Mesorhizobium liriopis]